MLRKIIFGVFMLVLSTGSQWSYADWAVSVGVGGPEHHHDWDRHRWDEHHDWRDHPYWGYHERYLPPDCTTIWSQGARYSYCDGVYYSYAGYGDWVTVQPPVGAYVSAIPPDFQAVIINGRTYYTSEGIYYVWTPRGYRVVPQPVVYEQPAPVVVEQPQQVEVAAPPPAPATSYGQDSFPLNIPNNSGGYTTVVIKRSGKGYIGPQGEYYASFPTVAQLKAMYVK